MALFRRLFYRKPPDRLLEIADRVYVFDCCFSTETMDQYKYKSYLDSIILQLREQFSDSSLMADNVPVKLDVGSYVQDIDISWDADHKFTKNFKAESLMLSLMRPQKWQMMMMIWMLPLLTSSLKRKKSSVTLTPKKDIRMPILFH
nr:unnamed protein product [Digitaria exilis]